VISTCFHTNFASQVIDSWFIEWRESPRNSANCKAASWGAANFAGLKARASTEENLKGIFETRSNLGELIFETTGASRTPLWLVCR
jgi:hypothetical protein